MIKIFIYLVIIFFTSSSFADDYKFMTNFKLKKNSSKFHLSIEHDNNDYQFNKINNMKDLNHLNYSGYRNVEGFKNNKRKDDITFASLVTGGGFLIILTGAATIIAVANAL